MDYLTTSLAEIGGISLHWSSDCNMACKYCYIEKDKKCMAEYNQQIRKSLENGSFVQNIKRIFANNYEQIESLSLWGAEPTINAKYFKSTMIELFDFFINANSMMFSTNALLGANVIYDYFVVPLYEYAETNKRKIHFDLQLSLDGPPEFNDDSRHAGAAHNTIETVNLLLDKLPQTADYFSISIFTKATLDISYMRKMNEETWRFQWYWQYFNDIQKDAESKLNNRRYISLGLSTVPTLVDPGYYTQQDGKDFATWIDNMTKLVDKRTLPAYQHNLLFAQPLIGLQTYSVISDNVLAQAYNAFSCSAGKNNVTIDHEGKLYSCNRLCRNSAMNDSIKHKSSMRSNTNLEDKNDKTWLRKTWGFNGFHEDFVSRVHMADSLFLTMAKAGQIQSNYGESAEDRLLAYYMISGLMCHIGVEEDYTQNSSILPTTYLRLLCNGAIEKMITYYNVEVSRGEITPWNIVM